MFCKCNNVCNNVVIYNHMIVTSSLEKIACNKYPVLLLLSKMRTFIECDIHVYTNVCCGFSVTEELGSSTTVVNGKETKVSAPDRSSDGDSEESSEESSSEEDTSSDDSSSEWEYWETRSEDLSSEWENWEKITKLDKDAITMTLMVNLLSLEQSFETWIKTCKSRSKCRTFQNFTPNYVNLLSILILGALNNIFHNNDIVRIAMNWLHVSDTQRGIFQSH